MLPAIGLSVLAVATAAVVAVAVMPSPGERGAAAYVTPSSQSASKAATPTTTPTPAPLKIKLPANPSVLIVGDSYTEGVGADSTDQGWAHVAGTELNLNPVIDGVRGTGFAWGGGADNSEGRQYSVRLREIADAQTITPDVLVLQGGQNDTLLKNNPEVTKAVTSTVSEAKKLWPNVQIVIMGPSAPEPLAATISGASDTVRDGANTAQVPYIDAAGEHWFTGQNSQSFYADGSHVNNEGHHLIADKFAAHWRELTKP
ncbi:SGNH/GDSL hydrolase family protein [Arthrobacter sp. ISL-72]|nr:SGNH/GDSL hydrolase family protein [Arthrobacter sp. ISL-72]